MNIIDYTPSSKMKELLLDYLQIFEDNNIPSLDFIQDLFREPVPMPIIYFASNLLHRNGLLKYDKDFKFCKPSIPQKKWRQALENLKISDITIHQFEENIKNTPYTMPKNKKITFRELTEDEYKAKSEWYDYEFTSLFVSTETYDDWWMNSDYLRRNFGVLHDEKMKGKKKLHILIAESEGCVLGYISISNYVRGADVFFNHGLPCRDEEIFYVNYIQTRQEAHRRHIATCLLGKAINQVFLEDNAYAIAYEPICNESELLLNRVIKPMDFDVYKRKYESYKEYKKYGSLESHIITKKKDNSNYFDFIDEPENY